jgi:predicted DNA-binding antitoxin AbrB/MazE fold protein
MQPVDASYEGGVLKLAKPVALRTGERVTVLIIRRPDDARWNLARLSDRAHEDVALAEAGLAEWGAALDAEDRR